MSSGLGACDSCLRRAWLVGSLSGHIETAVSDSPGQRARELLALDDAALARALAGSAADEILEEARGRDPSHLRSTVDAAGAWACCRHADSYPTALTGEQAPATLFGRGEPALLSELHPRPSVTIVGARRPSSYGREMAAILGRDAATSGLPVVSGMALGIDSCAHRGALAGGGLTVAILGSGVDLPHPARHRALYEQILERGLVLSELPPGTAPRRWTFPARNRIMAALGSMTVVVEARERSGSLITSNMASDLGREVGAVPGRVGSSPAAGANDLLRDGAHVVRSVQDVLDSLLGAGVLDSRRVAARRRGPELDNELTAVLDQIERGAGSADAVVRGSGLGAGEASAALARLELLGYVAVDSAGRYRRTTLALTSAD